MAAMGTTPGVQVKVLYDGYADANKRIQGMVVRGTIKMVHDIATIARRYAAVDTGYMRDHIVEEGGSVKALAFYSGFVEFGTRYMAAQPFMSVAAEEVAANAVSYFKGGAGGFSGIGASSPYYGGDGQTPITGGPVWGR